ncbi:MAG: acetyl-CoA hydrolase/transferase family protein [Bacteroidetes bacterium]|nr:acetyl-CoA hydrolase/transferase family protein [Bacteroidota bacterium]
MTQNNVTEISPVTEYKTTNGIPHTDSLLYRSKLRSVEEVVGLIKSDDNIFISGNAASPTFLLKNIAKRKDEVKNVSVYHMLLLGEDPLSEEGMSNHIRHVSLFVGSAERKMVAQGKADYVPVLLSEVPGLFHQRIIPLDVVYVMVSPPDNHGYVSLGAETVASKAAVENGKIIVAQVNEYMPRTHGDTFIHLSQIHHIFEHSEPLIELGEPQYSEVELRIAKFIAPLVEDGSTLQLGIGGIPNAVLSMLEGKKDLGVHTEMVSDGVLHAIEKGILTNARKNFHPMKAVATFVLGSRRLYDFVNDNPMFEFLPCDYTNNPFNVSRNDKMVSINSAIEIDLTGQVCAESIGQTIFSGFGGQLDFVRGAFASKGGKAIIALPSTAKNGTLSRITPFLKHGAGVVTTRGDVRYVVTEFGVASLYGKSLRQRAEELLAIAHPAFHDELEDEIRQRFRK